MHCKVGLLIPTEPGILISRYPPAEYLIGRLNLKVADVVAPTVLKETLTEVMFN